MAAKNFNLRTRDNVEFVNITSEVKNILAGIGIDEGLCTVYCPHMEVNSAAHIKSSLIGPSVTIPVEKGNLSLGTWQGIFFCEFDGPRSRTVTVSTAAGT